MPEFLKDLTLIGENNDTVENMSSSKKVRVFWLIFQSLMSFFLKGLVILSSHKLNFTQTMLYKLICIAQIIKRYT